MRVFCKTLGLSTWQTYIPHARMESRTLPTSTLRPKFVVSRTHLILRRIINHCFMVQHLPLGLLSDLSNSSALVPRRLSNASVSREAIIESIECRIFDRDLPGLIEFLWTVFLFGAGASPLPLPCFASSPPSESLIMWFLGENKSSNDVQVQFLALSSLEDSILEKSGLLLRSSLLVTSRRPVHPLLFLYPSLYFSISVPPKLRAFFRASYSTIDFLWPELLFRKTRSRRSKRER